MEEVFATYYHRMKPEAIIGGRIRYRIEGLSEAAYKEGARALTAALTGAYDNDNELFARVASMIRMGMLSTEVRNSAEMNKNGLGAGFDYYSGGADSVYTQLLTENACKEKLPLDDLYYSKVRFLISLDALEMGTYQYHDDSFGNRLYDGGWGWFDGEYAQRDNILEFIREEQNSFNRRNEVMLKERLDASFFKGIIVSDEKTKLDLISYLEKQNLIQNHSILDIAVDKFIRVGTHLSEELVS
jgi:hypothetical protein